MIFEAENRIDQIMHRTLYNLAYIEAVVKQAPDPEGPFEVTQLINSFAGALAHPWEKIKVVSEGSLERITLDEACKRRWPVLTNREEGEPEPESYYDMLRSIRNAFAHGNLAFYGDGEEIREIELWNQNSSGKRTWGTRVSVGTLRSFLDLFYRWANERIGSGEREGHAAD